MAIGVRNGTTVTVIRRAARNHVGDPGGPDTRHQVDGAAFAWESTSENTSFQESTTSKASLFVPTSADIIDTDRIELPDGSVWEVVGRPEWTGTHPLNGWNPGYMQIHLREA